MSVANRRSIRPPPPEALPSAARLFERRLRRDELPNLAQKFVHRLDTLVALLPIPHRDLPALLFAIPHHQHEGNLLQLSVTNLEIDFLVAFVDRGPSPGRYQTIANSA